MNFLDRFRYLLSVKESQARIIMSQNLLGKPVSTPANYESFSRFGYSKNVVVFTAISKVTTACAGINWVLYSKSGRKKQEIEDHPLLTLLDKPNPLQGTAQFIEAVIGYRMIAGNSYIEANKGLAQSGPPLELWPVRPDRMKVIPGANGYPAFYVFSNGGLERRWPVDPVTLTSQILHWKSFNPLSDWYGLSPLEAAMLSLDQNNAGQKWNLALLQNSATPSGVLQMKVSDSNPRGELTNEQYGRLKKEFEENYGGAKNAGRPLVIEGGLNWQAISLAPKDMDFINNKTVSATDIALALGVPPELMGFGAKTFNNYREARLAFYEETILPLMDSLRDQLNMWLTPAFGDSLWLDYDKDDIEALTWKREQKYSTLQSTEFLSFNEKREAAGYDAIGENELFIIDGTIYSREELASYDPTEEVEEVTPEPQNTEQPEETEEDETNDNAEQDDDADDSKGWKSFNLLNRNEKRKSWLKQNQRRKRLEVYFRRDVERDLEDLASRLAKTADALKGKDKKLIELALLQTEAEWLPEFKKTLMRHTANVVEDFGFMVLEEGKSLSPVPETKANRKFESFVRDWTSLRSGEQITTISSTNQKQIKKIVGEWVQTGIEDGDTLPDLGDYIQKEFGELKKWQAVRIARTEVAIASQQGALEAVKSLEIPSLWKEWVTANDDRVRDGSNGGADHGAMNGAEVPLEEKFGVPPDALMVAPCDPSAGADQVINCRCVLVYKSKNQGEL